MMKRKKLDSDLTFDSPLDLFICEKCGCEFPISPDANGEITCPKCEAIMNKSEFYTEIRKMRVWVSKEKIPAELQRAKARLERIPPVRFSCIPYYRRVARLRQAIFDLYQKQKRISLIQAIVMFTSFYSADFDERKLLRLLGENYDDETRKALREGGWLDRYNDDDQTDIEGFFASLGSIKVRREKERPGRLIRSDKLVLALDACVLMFCPKAYTHFLRDALRLRSQEYSVEWNRASAHRERWTKFRKAQKAVETDCRRIWKSVHGRDPSPTPKGWWERVALEQEMYENKYKTFGIA